MAEKFTAPRVLVVDDENLIRWSLRRALVALGCEVSDAGDASSARELASRGTQDFDVVLLDLKLPDSDDLSLLAKLRSLVPSARIILMTAFGTPETESQALALGAYRVVRKPFDVKDMAAAALAALRDGDGQSANASA